MSVLQKAMKELKKAGEAEDRSRRRRRRSEGERYDVVKVTPDMVKELRERTGVGMGKCKEALEQANGDMEKAIDILRKAGMASAVKKEGRETKEGHDWHCRRQRCHCSRRSQCRNRLCRSKRPVQAISARYCSRSC